MAGSNTAAFSEAEIEARFEEFRERMFRVTEAEAVWQLMELHSLTRQHVQGRYGSLFARAEAIAISTVLSRLAPDVFEDAVALLQENAD